MKTALRDAILVQKYAAAMSGVFSSGDLRRLFGEDTPVVLHRRICALVEGEVLTRFCRGVYVTPGFVPDVLAARVIEESYLSLGTVLARELMIGSVPAATVYAVKVGRCRRFVGPGLTLEYAGISKDLFFGYRPVAGVRYATPEKTLLDTLYFHLRGRAYSFNIYQDIDVSRLDRRTVDRWLGRYGNPKFVSFVKGYLDGRGK